MTKYTEDINNCWYYNVCEQDCTTSCIKYNEMNYLMKNSNVPQAKQKPLKLVPEAVDVEAFNKLLDIKDNVVDFVRDGKTLFIGSESPGCGKTSWAIKILLRYFDRVWAGNGFRIRGLFIHVPTFLMNCKNFGELDLEFNKLKKMIPNVDLIIFDDMASTKVTGFDYLQLIAYIDQRTLANKATIYTANCCTKEALAQELGDKLASRIWQDNKGEVVILKGGDRR